MGQHGLVLLHANKATREERLEALGAVYSASPALLSDAARCIEDSPQAKETNNPVRDIPKLITEALLDQGLPEALVDDVESIVHVAVKLGLRSPSAVPEESFSPLDANELEGLSPRRDSNSSRRSLDDLPKVSHLFDRSRRNSRSSLHQSTSLFLDGVMGTSPLRVPIPNHCSAPSNTVGLHSELAPSSTSQAHEAPRPGCSISSWDCRPGQELGLQGPHPFLHSTVDSSAEPASPPPAAGAAAEQGQQEVLGARRSRGVRRAASCCPVCSKGEGLAQEVQAYIYEVCGMPLSADGTSSTRQCTCPLHSANRSSSAAEYLLPQKLGEGGTNPPGTNCLSSPVFTPLPHRCSGGQRRDSAMEPQSSEGVPEAVLIQSLN